MNDFMRSVFDSCGEIGGVLDCNGPFQDGLIRRFEEKGRAFEDLTVGEVLEVIKTHKEWYNSLPG